MATFESEFKAFRESLCEGTVVTSQHIRKLAKLEALQKGDYKALYEMEVADHQETERKLRGEIEYLKTPARLCAAPAGNWYSFADTWCNREEEDKDSCASMPPLEPACCGGTTIWPPEEKDRLSVLRALLKESWKEEIQEEKDHFSVLRALLKEQTPKEKEDARTRLGILGEILERENQRKAQEKIPYDDDELYS